MYLILNTIISVNNGNQAELLHWLHSFKNLLTVSHHLFAY